MNNSKEDKKKCKSFYLNIIFSIVKFITPKANPDFESKINNITYWLLEFEDDKGFSTREIGIDLNDKVIAKMPYNKNYGYWTDSQLKYQDFLKLFSFEIITEKYFLQKWSEL